MNKPNTAPQPVIDLASATRRRVAADQHWVTRLDAQAGFAEALAEFHPESATEWKRLAAQARAVMTDAVARGGDLKAACTQGEAVLAPVAPTAKSHTMHCAGHAHIDMNWMWSWQETVAVTVDTFRTMLALMDEFPGFVFSQSQASVYAIVREFEPDMLKRIAARVKEGRWEVTASHWVEGDRNLAGGEALCRHLLYTRGIMKELFDLNPEDVPVDWSPDTFGHAATMPTIDASGGAKYLYCCRTGVLDNPPVFWWRAPDGSQVLVNRETAWYNGEIDPANIKGLVDFRRTTGLRDWLLLYGVGDHGGGPTRRDLRRLIDMDAWPVYPRFRFARVADFFKLLEKEGHRWPTIARELNFEFTGCYTSQSAIKRGNRIGETVCATADGAAALATRLAGVPYPGATLRNAWTDTLFSHFHDILPGSGVAATRQFHQGMVQRIQAATGQVRAQSLRAIAGKIDTSFAGTGGDPAAPSEWESRGLGGGAGRLDGELSRAAWVGDGPRPLVVFNPSAWPRTGVVTLTAWDGDAGDTRHLHDRAFAAILPDGRTIAPQRVGNGDYWGHRYVDLAVPVEVPANGWTVVALREQAAPPAIAVAVVDIDHDGGHGQRSNNAAGRLEIRNQHLRARIDRVKGGIASLIDIASGIDYATPGAGFAILELVRERPVGMSAWIIGDSASDPQDLTVEGVDVGEQGPWRVTIKVRVKTGDSRFTVTYGLSADSRRLDIAIDGRWLERGGPEVGIPRLQMRFPAALAKATPRYEVPFGSVARATGAGREVPALRWATLDGAASDGRAAGLALLNDGKHGHSVHGDGVLRLNLIRSSYDPDPLPELGDHAIRLAVVPYLGTANDANLTRWASELDAPLVGVSTTVHAGSLPAQAELVRSDHDGVVITQLKGAEADGALVLRVVNTTTSVVEANLVLAKALGTVRGAALADVLERPLAGGKLSVSGGQARVKLPAHGLATVLVELA